MSLVMHFSINFWHVDSYVNYLLHHDFFRRCLTGPFQSDALVVRRGCVFDHIHDSDKCQSYGYWGDVATKTCSEQHSMNRDSFAMLLPCDTDMFAGAEFVCCPKGANSSYKYSGITLHLTIICIADNLVIELNPCQLCGRN